MHDYPLSYAFSDEWFLQVSVIYDKQGDLWYGRSSVLAYHRSEADSCQDD